MSKHLKNIYLIVGPSGSGKTTLINNLNEMFGYSIMESYTDRPRRTPDERGHLFISKERFDELQPSMIAFTNFDGHRYGVTKELLENCDLYAIDPNGVEFLRDHYNGSYNFVVLGLRADPGCCRQRMLERGDSADKVKQRIAHDLMAFRNLACVCDITYDATRKPLDLMSIVHDFIQNCEWKGARWYA